MDQSKVIKREFEKPGRIETSGFLSVGVDAGGRNAERLSIRLVNFMNLFSNNGSGCLQATRKEYTLTPAVQETVGADYPPVCCLG